MFTAFGVTVPNAESSPIEVTSGITIDQEVICKLYAVSSGTSIVVYVGDSDVSPSNGWAINPITGTNAANAPTEIRLLPGDQVYAITNGGSPGGTWDLQVVMYSAGGE